MDYITPGCHNANTYLDLQAKYILPFHLSYTFNTNIGFLSEASAPKCAWSIRSPWAEFAEPYKHELNTCRLIVLETGLQNLGMLNDWKQNGLSYEVVSLYKVRASPDGNLMRHLYKAILNIADYGGHAVYGMDRLRSLDRWNRGFKTH